MLATGAGHLALDLLDQAVLLRLDPDPEIAILVDAATDEPVTVGTDAINPELYVAILCLLERADSLLGSLGWHLSCAAAGNECAVPHDAFRHFEFMLWRSGSCSRDQLQYDDLIEMVDNVLDSPAFATVHHALAGDANATGALAHQKS